MLASEYYSPITTTRSAIQYYHSLPPSLPHYLPRASLTQERKINFYPMFAIILERQYDHVWQVLRNFYIVIPITISRYWPRKGLHSARDVTIGGIITPTPWCDHSQCRFPCQRRVRSWVGGLDSRFAPMCDLRTNECSLYDSVIG